MALIQTNMGVTLPGETAIAAIYNFHTELIKILPADQAAAIAQRILDDTKPFHEIIVVINNNIASFLEKVLKMDVKKS